MTDTIRQTTTIVDALQTLRDEALHQGRRITENGKGIDAHQPHAERLAYLATEVEAARALFAYAQDAQQHGEEDASEMALGFAAEVGHKILGQADVHLTDFGFPESFLAETLGRNDVKAAIRVGAHETAHRGRERPADLGVAHAERFHNADLPGALGHGRVHGQ